MSLIEVLVAISVMAVAATYYGSTVVAAASHHHGYQEIETATLLYLRQVVRIRAQDPRAANRPFDQEDDFGTIGNANSCIEFPYQNDGARDLDPPTTLDREVLATAAGHFEFPAGSPWLIDIQNNYRTLWDEGYRVTVNAARLRTDPNPANPQREYRLIKYAIRIDRLNDPLNPANGRVNLLTGQIFAEVP